MGKWKARVMPINFSLFSSLVRNYRTGVTVTPCVGTHFLTC